MEVTGNFSAGGKARMQERCLHASVKVEPELVQCEVSVVSFDSTVFGDVESSRTAEIAVGVLVVSEQPIPLTGNSRTTFAFVVSVKTESDDGAKTLAVCPFDCVFVKVYVGPIVADGGLQCVDRFEYAVAHVSCNGLCSKGVAACSYAVASIPTDIFDTDCILVCIIGVGVRKPEIKRRAVVVPCDKEFLLLSGIETVAIDEVYAFTEFEQQT